jgi:beta-xylosidase
MTEALKRPESAPDPTAAEPWRDPALPVADRVADLVGRMTLEEKVQQLTSFWAAPHTPGQPVAPMQNDFTSPSDPGLDEVADGGLGHLTRVFGTEPVHPREGILRLVDFQKRVAAGNRFGIPAIVHEECLTGLATWTATAFPTPLAWGASFDAALVEEMAATIAATMRQLGVHQGLAPVLDVVRDYRWGRTEETIGEDPQLVGTLGAAFVRGLEGAGIIATVKHFAGYSTSRAGRNHAPAAVGPRELADVILEPFVAALRNGGARSVMHSYADVDGIPPAADPRLLTDVLRGQLGFAGVVVSDYFGISYLEATHHVAGSRGEAAALALRAGLDLELPARRCYGEPLLEQVRAGRVPEAWVDRSVTRVLSQKCELGLLDRGWEQQLDDLAAAADTLQSLDPPTSRHLARRLAEASTVLLANDGLLPLDPAARTVALVGPVGDDPLAMLGCYSFPIHVGTQYPQLGMGIEIPSLAEALRAELPQATVTQVRGCTVDGTDPAGPDEDDGGKDGIAAAVAAARAADVCVLALGDRAGLWGAGTSGEGCDASTLALPGRQAALAEAVLATGTPTVLVLLTGRPYALGGLADAGSPYPRSQSGRQAGGRAGAVLQAFFPGEEGAAALAGIISGRTEPSGRLPVSIPRDPGGQPATYLHAPLGERTTVSAADPTPLYPFGHGLTWTRFTYTDLTAGPAEGGGPVPTDGAAQVAVTVTNAGERAGTEVVQLYLSDPVASVVRPVRWLAGWARVRLAPGQAARVVFTVHADRTSFTGADLRRIVEPGRIDVAAGPSSRDLPVQASFELAGPERTLGPDRVLDVPVQVTIL